MRWTLVVGMVLSTANLSFDYVMKLPVKCYVIDGLAGLLCGAFLIYDLVSKRSAN